MIDWVQRTLLHATIYSQGINILKMHNSYKIRWIKMAGWYDQLHMTQRPQRSCSHIVKRDRRTNGQTEKLHGMKFKITKNLWKFICSIIRLKHISGAVSKFPKAEELRFKTKSDGCVSIL